MSLPSGAEIAAALRGLAAALRGDPAALSWYDLSVDGFWRSFWPPLIAAAAYFAILQPGVIEGAIEGAIEGVIEGAVDSADGLAGMEASRLGFSLVQAVLFLASWLIYLAAMVVLCRAFRLTDRFAVFVTLYNWAQGIVSMISVPVLAATQWGLLPAGAMAGWNFVLLFVWLYVVAQIARVTFGATPILAMGIAALDLGIALLLHGLAGSLL
jgi:hypothetical protein